MKPLTSILRIMYGWWLDDFLTLVDRIIRRPKPPTVPVTVPPSPPSERPETRSEDPVERRETPSPEPVLSWEKPREAYELTRMLCDEFGLTVEQKNIVCACIYQESRFYNRRSDGSPIINENKKDGVVWSTDYGIVQVNDYWHIGPGKTFPSVEYVMDNPGLMVRWLVKTMAATGRLQPWSSYTTGAYKVWLRPESPMWNLKS